MTESPPPHRAPLPADLFDAACPSTLTPFRIADKWGGMVVVCLADGPRRFSELRVPLARVAPKVLTETLRALERDGYVRRTAYAENPPRVEYELTGFGRTLLPAIDGCRDWAEQNLAAVVAAREAFQERRAGR